MKLLPPPPPPVPNKPFVSLLSIAVINNQSKATSGGKGLFPLPGNRPSLREVRAGNPKQEPGGRN